MSLKLKLLIGSIVVIMIAVLSFVFFAPEPTVPDTNPTPSLPVASSTPTVIEPGVTLSGGTMAVARRGGGQAIIVNDFLNNGVTIADPENPSSYYLAGSIGYCLEDGTCPSGAYADGFNVVYDAPEEFFTVALFKEPLGQTRADAEQFLLKALGIPKAELCNVNYYLGTSESVNSFYAGKNLGFSFCPGTTALPR